MSEGKVTIRRHVRRRTGHTAKIAARLGFDPAIEVESYTRRRQLDRPAGQRGWKETRPGMWERQYSLKYMGVVYRAPDGRWFWELIDQSTTETVDRTLGIGERKSDDAKREVNRAWDRAFHRDVVVSPVPLGTRVRKEIGEF